MMEARIAKIDYGRHLSRSSGDAIASSPSYGSASRFRGDVSLRCFLSAHSRLAFLERSAASSLAALAVIGLSLISQLFLSLMLAVSCAWISLLRGFSRDIMPPMDKRFLFLVELPNDARTVLLISSAAAIMELRPPRFFSVLISVGVVGSSRTRPSDSRLTLCNEAANLSAVSSWILAWRARLATVSREACWV